MGEGDGEEAVGALSGELERFPDLPLLSSSFVFGETGVDRNLVCSIALLSCSGRLFLCCPPLLSPFSMKRTKVGAFPPPQCQTPPVTVVVVAGFLVFVVDVAAPAVFLFVVVQVASAAAFL